tara:strand:+ start:1327 stop:1851 length:525 start_codon:yes stop_codon:yes gene_type:complete
MNYTALRKKNRNFWGRWYSMNMRCLNNEPGYRDVKVCDDWHIEISGEQGFLNFAEDMMADFDEDLTLDRIDPKGNYDAHNCRWVDSIVQNRNTRFHKYTERGKALVRMHKRWGHSKAVKQRFWSRHKRGWSWEDIINTPPSFTNRKGHMRPQDLQKRRKLYKKRTIWQKITSII